MRCGLYRAQVSHVLDADREMPEGIQRHLDRCGACAAFHQHAVNLHRRLRAEAGQADVPVSGDLHARIMRCVRESLPVAIPARQHPSWAWAAAAAAVAVLLAAGVVSRLHRPTEAAPQEAVLASASHLNAASATLLGAASQIVSVSEEVVEAAQLPLVGEYERLQQDVVGVARFLAGTLDMQI